MDGDVDDDNGNDTTNFIKNLAYLLPKLRG